MKISIDIDEEEFLHYEYSSVDESSNDNDSPLTSSTDEEYFPYDSPQMFVNFIIK